MAKKRKRKREHYGADDREQILACMDCKKRECDNCLRKRDSPAGSRSGWKSRRRPASMRSKSRTTAIYRSEEEI